MTSPHTLPVTALFEQLFALSPGARVVLEAPPGAGKSTALPLALIDAPLLQGQRILMLQPRRIAAIAIAHFLAHQLGEIVGQTVGYHIRGDAKFSSATHLLIVTEGIYTQYLQNDPELEGYGLVIFDEFHERNLASDLGLAMTLEATAIRTDLSLLIMSATLPAEAIAAWLGQAQVLKSEGRQFPIDVRYHPVPAGQSWLFALPALIRQAMQLAEQGVLVFVPGQREIDFLLEQFQASSDWQVMALHRQVPLAEQKRILNPQEGQRRLVIATNIAETSVTIPAIDVVVDSGRERQAEYYPQHGITRLTTRRISKASAQQRAGRAGRLGPGICLRLWGKNEEHGVRDYQVAEIETAELTGFLFECRRWGSDPNQLKFFTPPSSAHLSAADSLLQRLDICHANGALTTVGHALAEFSSEPRLARLLAQVKAASAAHRCTAAWLVAQLEQHVIPSSFPTPLQQLNRSVQQRFAFWCRQLQVSGATPEAELVSELLLWAFPDRIAKQRGRSDRYLLSSGGGAMIHHQDTRQRDTWLLVVDMMLTEKQTDAIIRTAIRLTEDDLQHPAVHRQQNTEVDWSGPQQRLRATQIESIGAIRVNERVVEATIDEAQRLAALSQYARAQMQQQGLEFFTLSKATRQWLARAKLYQQLLQPDGWPSLAQAILSDELALWAEPYWQAFESLQQLRKWDPLEALRARFTYQQLQELERECPSHLLVPSGRQVAIDYLAESPIVAVKLQEMFGEPVSPAICRNQQTITIDLLSPAGRLLQRTSDLASFWDNAYQQVKKEMKGRYPKHPWPDEPRQALATHKTKRHLE